MADQEEPQWQAARLIPVAGIGGAAEQERRAVSAVLAVLAAVDDFGTAFTKSFGAPKGKVRSFVEPEFITSDGAKVRPDGAITVVRGKRSWTALVEVKTKRNALKPDQVEQYLDVAREKGFDAVITISNQIVRVPGQHPVEVSKRKLRKVELCHISWARILTMAIRLRAQENFKNLDQAYLLNELIRYLEHSASGALDFDDMGERWVKVREAARSGTLRATDAHAVGVAGRWEELLSFVVLRLGRELDADVEQVFTRKETADPTVRIANLVDGMVDRGVLDGAIQIPNTVGSITVTADLRSRQVITSVRVGAPKSGRPATRVNWLLRQLKNSPDDVRIDAYGVRSRTSMSDLLGDVRGDPSRLVPLDGRELATFVISLCRPMGLQRGAGPKTLIDSVVTTIDAFYVEVVQRLKEWSPPTPSMSKAAEQQAHDRPEKQTETTSASAVDSAPVAPAAEPGESSVGASARSAVKPLGAREG